MERFERVEKIRQALQAFLRFFGESDAAERVSHMCNEESIRALPTKPEAMKALGISKETVKILHLLPVFSRHIARLGMTLPPTMRCMRHMCDFLRYHYAGSLSDYFALLCFDKNEEPVSVCNIESSFMDASSFFREVLSETKACKAVAVLLAYNGYNDNTPLPDVELLRIRKLMRLLRAKGIVFIDYILIGRKTFVSLRDKGYLSAAVQPRRASDMPLYRDWLQTPEQE